MTEVTFSVYDDFTIELNLSGHEYKGVFESISGLAESFHSKYGKIRLTVSEAVDIRNMLNDAITESSILSEEDTSSENMFIYDGWIGVDLDGTLAEALEWKGSLYIGKPIKKMVDRVKVWLSEGKEVRIFTARADKASRREFGSFEERRTAIEQWCIKHIGVKLRICVSKSGAVEFWDDRAIQVIPNTGMRADGKE